MGTEDTHSFLAWPHTCACQAANPLVSGGTSPVSCLVAFRPMGAAGPPSFRSLGGGMSPWDCPVGQSGTLAGCAWLCVLDNVLEAFPKLSPKPPAMEKHPSPVTAGS